MSEARDKAGDDADEGATEAESTPAEPGQRDPQQAPPAHPPPEHPPPADSYQEAPEPPPTVLAAAAPPPSPQPATTIVQARGGAAAAIAWLALLLVLLLAGGGVWTLLEGQRREAQLQQRLQGLEANLGRDASSVEQVNRNLQRQLELEIAGVQTALRGEIQEQALMLREQASAATEQRRAVQRMQEDGTRKLQVLENELRQQAAAMQQQLTTELESFASQLALQRSQLEQVSSDDRNSWLLAEAQYLLRLANQRLIMAGDTLSADTLLRSADKVLQQLDDPSLRGVRAALASDLAAVRAVPRLDLDGTYLRLAALMEQAAALQVFALPDTVAGAEVVAADDWTGRLGEGLSSALKRLSEYIVVRRRDTPVEPLMDPQWEALVRQNLRMLLEQAQAALLSGNQRFFRESLQRAGDWVNEFTASDEQGARAVLAELQALQDTQIVVAVPDISGTLAAVQEALLQRSRQDGAD